MYIKMTPSYKDYLWGGNKLVSEFHKDFKGDVLAESWELSTHPDGPSKFPWGGSKLKEFSKYIKKKGNEKILGKNCEKFQDFPVLIKLIDAKEALSVQVHPDDAYAMEHEGQYGKVEMWYVVDHEPGAFVYFGFAKEVTKDEIKERIEAGTLTEVLNKVEVHKGDTFFIEAGTIHAIGAGIVIAEIQQNSNVTYRVFDYDRVDKDGKKRELHIQKALDVMNTSPIVPKHFSPHLANCKYFTVDKFYVNGKYPYVVYNKVGEDSFLCILFLEGEGKIGNLYGNMTYQKGDCFFVEAGSEEIIIGGECEALLTYIPS